MNAALAPSLAALRAGQTLPPEALAAAFEEIMEGRAAEEEIRTFLEGTIRQMDDPACLVAGARALRKRMTAVTAPEGAIDVCGTGGDGKHTLNVSTAVAFVLAGCGVVVAKHGNRAMSSRCGAADVLEALGVRLTAEAAVLETALREARVAFLFAQNHHPAMRHVASARRALGKRTIFNLLGPLANPARVTRQLIGVYQAQSVAPVAQALAALGSEGGWVVHGLDGVDEISLEAETLSARVEAGAVATETLGPAAFGAPPAPSAEIIGGDAAFNAEALRTLLERPTDANQAYRAVVQANAAAALIVAGRTRSLQEGYKMAGASLEDGAAAAALARLVAITTVTAHG